MKNSSETAVKTMKNKTSVSGGLFLLADFFTVLYAGCVYFAAFAGPAWVLYRLRDIHPLLLLGCALCGWFIAALIFSSVLILTKKIFIRQVPFGRFRLTGKKVGRWIAADRVMKIMLRSPFRSLITENGFYRLFFYRGMGAQIDATTLLGNGAKFPEPWAVKIGRNAVIGDGAVLSGHKVEHNIVTLGVVEIGDDVLIGAGSIVFPDVKIGDNATIGAGSVIPRGTIIACGETWAGNPATKIVWKKLASAPNENMTKRSRAAAFVKT